MGQPLTQQVFREPQSLTLRVMFDQIRAQAARRGIVYASLSESERVAYASECVHALSVEVAELASSWSFASWKTTPTDIENIKREVIDCFFFLANICACFNVSVWDLAETFQWVLENNDKRIANGEHKPCSKEVSIE